MTITFIENDGGKVAVEVEGEGPLVVCSPGLGDTREAYAPLAQQLVAAGYRVARMDLRGHNDSTPTFSRYGDEASADDILKVVETLGGGPVVLAGASMSAAACTIAAGRRPDQIAGIILIGPFLRNGASAIVRWLLHFAFYRPLGPYLWRSYAATLWPGLGDKAKERAASTTALLQRPGYWSAFHASTTVDHSIVAPYISKVKAAVLVVIGDADPDWTDPLAEAKWVASNFTDVDTVTVQGAGHAPQYERPEIVSPAVLEFLQKIRTGTTFKMPSA
ncbi:putative alpha beta hydrolase fold protein [Phaeoacremonium minimum UCRPA7]|uniref:Putative alpha beta hydrolase fold protein n=1 Tax=Phaeoacremonium minimum (strain UCR-PA7) TaxID=1286976 RepID=R8BEB8_PHAM7|nr:putative alpha beta hydrolase fold protein [Phaeoacremonium minimum UCRPA7]EON97643.1 putative alpha beta hydrolase fold protein [Phaeoacremonium minimum UCRPA7]